MRKELDYEERNNLQINKLEEELSEIEQKLERRNNQLTDVYREYADKMGQIYELRKQKIQLYKELNELFNL